MHKKQVKVVLPRYVSGDNQLFHLALPERALHTPHNQTICYSHAGTAKNIVPSGTPEREELEEFTFAQVLSPDAISYFRQHPGLDLLKRLSIVVFGDNSAVKESLLHTDNTTNNIVKELINSMLRYGSTVEATMTLFNNTSSYHGKPKKASLENYDDFSQFYSKLIDAVGQNDMQAYHLLLKMEFVYRNELYTVKLVRLIDNVCESELQDILSYKRSNQIIKNLGDSHTVMFYWCPSPTKKCRRLLKLLEEQSQVGADVTGFTETLSSNSKIARTETLGSERNHRKTKDKKSERSHITAKSKERGQKNEKQAQSIRREIFKNLENEANSKLEVRGKIMDIVIQDKNKRIQALQASMAEKDRQIEQLELRLARQQGDKQRLQRQCSDNQKRVGQLLKEIVQLRLLTEQESSKVVKTEHRIEQYEHEVENLHSDIKQTLDKLNSKNQKLKDEISRLKKQMADSKKAEESRAKKLEKFLSDMESNHGTQMTKLTESHKQAIKELQEDYENQKDKVSSLLNRNQELLDDNGRLNKQVKQCYESLIQAQHKYGELCMKLRSLAHFKDSEVVTLNTIIDSL